MSRDKTDLIRIAEKFEIEGELENVTPHGNGHINDTFLLTCRGASGEQVRYILQRMNHEVFKDPEGLMENIVGVTAFLQKKIAENGRDPAREALNVIPVRDGGSSGPCVGSGRRDPICAGPGRGLPCKRYSRGA